MANDDSLSIREWRLLYSISIRKTAVPMIQLRALGFVNEAESLRNRGVLDYYQRPESYALNQFGSEVVSSSVAANPGLVLGKKQLLFD